MTSAPLFARMRRLRLLLPGEDVMLDRADVRALSEEAQLRFLAQNRRTGVVITIFALGVRLMLLAGAGVASIGVAFDESIQLGLAGVPIGLVLLGFAAYGLWAGRARVRELRRPVPTLAELEQLERAA